MTAVTMTIAVTMTVIVGQWYRTTSFADMPTTRSAGSWPRCGLALRARANGRSRYSRETCGGCTAAGCQCGTLVLGGRRIEMASPRRFQAQFLRNICDLCTLARDVLGKLLGAATRGRLRRGVESVLDRLVVGDRHDIGADLLAQLPRYCRASEQTDQALHFERGEAFLGGGRQIGQAWRALVAHHCQRLDAATLAMRPDDRIGRRIDVQASLGEVV